MARRRIAPITKTPGLPGAPSSKGQPSGTPAGARQNFQHTTRDGRDVIPRRTINGSGRTNQWLQGGSDG